MTLTFLRNKVVEVEVLPGNDIAVFWRLNDDLLKIEVRLIIQTPELEITKAEISFFRYIPLSCKNASEKIKRIEGVNIGGGLRKITAGILGGKNGSSVLVDAVLECCNAVILYFTRPSVEAEETIKDSAEKIKGAQEMVKLNPRLIRSCIAFQDNSPIMKGIQL